MTNLVFLGDRSQTVTALLTILDAMWHSSSIFEAEFTVPTLRLDIPNCLTTAYHIRRK